MLFDDADLQLESAAFRFNLPIGGTSFVPAEAIQIRRSTVLQRWMIRGKH